VPNRKIPIEQLEALQEVLEPGTLVSICRQHIAGIPTQQELADAARQFMPAGMSMNRKTIQGLEACEPDYSYPTGRYVTAIHLLAIARALGIPAAWLSPDLANDQNVATIIAFSPEEAEKAWRPIILGVAVPAIAYVIGWLWASWKARDK